MTEDIEFTISKNTLNKLLNEKKSSGFSDKSWDDWFSYLFSQSSEKSSMEKTIENFFYKNDFEQWVKSFAENLSKIQNESSAKELINSHEKKNAIVIGAGPSLRKYKHLQQLAESNYDGIIVCTDRSLISALKAGVTPERFPNFFVVTIDAYEDIKKYYDDYIVNKYGSKIKGIFSVLTFPNAVNRAREAGIQIHWIHTLFDYNEGKKSFNQISALMIRSKNQDHKLPAIQTGGNVGTSGWFVSWKILKCKTICLIGINHGWEEDDPEEKIISHGYTGDVSKIKLNLENSQRMFPKIFNPYFKTNCIMDPIFQYYSSAFKEFIIRSPKEVNTINATEGGSIFGDRITCMRFSEYLAKF